MMASSAFPARRPGRLARLLVWCAGLVLVLQLLGATQYRHDLAHPVSDCAGCLLAAQPPSPPPPSVVPETAVAAALVGYLPPLQERVQRPSAAGFLLPHAQAPPILLR